MKLGYQAVGTTNTSIGRNWVHDRPLFSQVTVGAGPVNFTFKNGKPKYLVKNNIGNIVTHGLGFLNYTIDRGFSKNPTADFYFDSDNLAFHFTGGYINKLSNRFNISGWIGAYAVIGSSFAENTPFNDYFTHETNHTWQSRFFNDSFVPIWLIMGVHSKYHGFDFNDHNSPTGTLNFWELQADGK